MSYKKEFHKLQKEYITSYPNALRMRSYLPSIKNRDILDVGCGSGLDLTFFKQMGADKVCGNDISKELLMVAKDAHPDLDIRNDSFNYLTWKDNVFDVVWSKYAINCSNDITLPIKEMYRVCKDGGITLLQVTHPLKTLSLLKSKDYFDHSVVKYPLTDGVVLEEPHHTMADWINAIIESGFTIIKCEEILNKNKSEYKDMIVPSAIIFILKK